LFCVKLCGTYSNHALEVLWVHPTKRSSGPFQGPAQPIQWPLPGPSSADPAALPGPISAYLVGPSRAQLSPDQRPHPTPFAFQGQMQGKRLLRPSTWPCGSRVLLIPPAIRGRGVKVCTTVLLPSAGKRQQQALMAADACSTPVGHLFITD
jgi:hypothetical protein